MNTVRRLVDLDEQMHRRYPKRIALGELVVFVLIALVLGALIGTAVAQAACEPYPVAEHSPTGVVNCEVYGEGVASQWNGPGVARNDCVYPWTACTPILITSLETGLALAITPTMYGDLYLGDDDPMNDRIVDLDPAALAKLGLDPSRGLHPVRVDKINVMLPNTAMAVDNPVDTVELDRHHRGSRPR